MEFGDIFILYDTEIMFVTQMTNYSSSQVMGRPKPKQQLISGVARNFRLLGHTMKQA